ncbi:MAG: hypothetical protein ACREMC_06485, partial [Gemmatimonadales bacterium]
DQIARLQPTRIAEGSVFRAGGLELPIREGQTLQIRDQVILFTIAAALPGRAVAFGVSSGRGSWLGLDPHLVMQGLAYTVFPGRPDTVPRFVPGIQGTRVDPARTALLADSVFRYGRLFEAPTLDLDASARQVATAFSLVYVELGNAAALRGDRAGALAYLRRAHHLNPSPPLAEIIRRVETEGVEGLFRP